MKNPENIEWVHLVLNNDQAYVLFLIIVIFVGLNVPFYLIHYLGLAGIPRRYSDYWPVASCTNEKYFLGKTYLSFYCPG